MPSATLWPDPKAIISPLSIPAWKLIPMVCLWYLNTLSGIRPILLSAPSIIRPLVNYPLKEKIISFGAYLLSRLLLGINIHDTAGLKLFRRPVLEKSSFPIINKNYAIDLNFFPLPTGLIHPYLRSSY